MKAIIEFNLPEETSEHLTAVKSGKLALIIFNMDNYLRNKIKHDELSIPVENALQEARDFLSNTVGEFECYEAVND